MNRIASTSTSANGAQRRWQRVGVLVIAAGMFVATAYVFAT